MHVTVGQEKVHVKNSPFSVLVDDGVVHPTTSTSVGQGLVSGTAGDAFNFTVQAKDTRNIEVQTISTSAYVVPTVHEVQNLTCVKQSGSFTVSFRGVDSDPINFNANAMTVANTLKAMPTISTVTVSHVGAVDEVCKGGMLVTFTGELGDVSLLSSTDVNVAVAENVKGQTAFRPAISKLTCTATVVHSRSE